jgi:hypothetical protein
LRAARLLFALIFVITLGAHLCHVRVLWAEETLPLAAARQMLFGETLYRDVWFDKPPLLPSAYLLWAGREGWPLRLAGTCYLLLCCWLTYRFARDLWGHREALWSAVLLAFFLTFDFASGVLPLAADLLMLAPHVAAVHLACRGRAFWSGVLAGIAFLVNAKGVFVLAACALWVWPSAPAVIVGFLLPNAAAAMVLWSQAALLPYYDEVWRWGRLYAGGTFLENPLRSGLLRTASWLGFHAALVAGAIAAWRSARRPKDPLADPKERLHWIAWAFLSLAGVLLGWRFFPRYYVQLLPVTTLLAARGFAIVRRERLVLAVLLLIPLARFGPRYALLARELMTGAPTGWADIAMDRDSRNAANIVRAVSHRGDTLFVWGFRPELYVYTGLPAATRFLDSQPLTGVPADRHLSQSEPVETTFTARHRAEVAHSRPQFIVDGLSLQNPRLSMSRYPELRPWLARYRETGRTGAVIVYRLLAGPARDPLLQER